MSMVVIVGGVKVELLHHTTAALLGDKVGINKCSTSSILVILQYIRNNRSGSGSETVSDLFLRRNLGNIIAKVIFSSGSIVVDHFSITVLKLYNLKKSPCSPVLYF
jgi:hypothetical protein